MNIEKQGIKTTITLGDFEVQTFVCPIAQTLYVCKGDTHHSIKDADLDKFLEAMMEIKAKRDQFKG